MNKYKIVVYNSLHGKNTTPSVIYEGFINADNENDALVIFLNNNTICSGDKIEII